MTRKKRKKYPEKFCMTFRNDLVSRKVRRHTLPTRKTCHFSRALRMGNAPGLLCLMPRAKTVPIFTSWELRKNFIARALERCFTRHTRIWLGNVARRIFKSIQFKRDNYKEYDVTNRFYVSVGYKELECFPTLWGECNTCQLYIKYIGN